MSEFHVQVVRIGAIEKHPNADSLSITQVHGGYPVLFKTGEYTEGDLAVYVPIDALVPVEEARWSFLGGHRRIRAKKLRGIFSMGLLTPADSSWVEGQDVAAELAIEKYDIERAAEAGYTKLPGADTESPSGDVAQAPVYDLEGYRRARHVLLPGEAVWISEKLHGCNARFMHDGSRLWVGSRTRWLKETFEVDGASVQNHSVWWDLARKLKLEEVLSQAPGLVFYGEAYGQVQDLRYGVGKDDGARLAIFDVLDPRTRTYLDFGDMQDLVVGKLGLHIVPLLFLGPWDPALTRLAEGLSVIKGADHVREGIVIKPLRERQERSIGRVVLKLHGEGYLLRKGAA